MISGPIFQALRGLVDNRCYPSTFPQPPAVLVVPAIRYTVSADANPDLCGTDGGSTDNFSVQFDVVAKTYGAADLLRDQVVAALMEFYPPAVREFENHTYDVETKNHRFILVYSVHPSYIGPLQVAVRESAGVLDVCDVSMPVSNPTVVESGALFDSCLAGVELYAAVSEAAAVSATDAVEPSALESAAVSDVATASAARPAGVSESAAASEASAVGGSATTAVSESAFASETMAATVARAAIQSEVAAAAAAHDATLTLHSALLVSWLNVTEPDVPTYAYLSWVQLSLPEPDSSGPSTNAAYVSWAQLELPDSTFKVVAESAGISDSCDAMTRAFLSWAQIEIPSP